jgi:hypothetical protein
MPLFPFSDATAVSTWQESYRTGGHQPWHLDPGSTALAFAAYLGYQNVDKVISVATDAAGAHVSVGFTTGGPVSATSTAAVVHLVRWGTGTNLPWEVVGTDDSTFSLTEPAYASLVRSPITAGGSISGADESIKLEVLSLASTTPVGGFCCVAAGGTNRAWAATVSSTAPPGAVVTIAASTGGHLATVERFTVTGVVVAPAATASTASCDTTTILTVVRTLVALPPSERIVSVQVKQCQNGYARVIAVPSNATCGQPGGTCFDNDQILLEAVAGHWSFLDSGSGLDCSNPQRIPPNDLPACRALGLT